MRPPGNDPQNDSSGLELDRPARGPSPSGPRPPRRTVSNPELSTVRSAERLQPVGPAPRRTMSSDSLREGAVDTVMNSMSILGELAEDFRTSDRYFKYKVFVILAWAFLSVSSVTVACTGQGPSNDIEATLVVTGEGGRTIYAVKNASVSSWHDMEIVVNGKYRTTQSEVEANAAIALSPAVLFDDTGKRAPNDLAIRDIVVHVADPEADVDMLKNGKPQQ